MIGSVDPAGREWLQYGDGFALMAQDGRAWLGEGSAVGHGLVDRLESVDLLVTGRVMTAAGPTDLGRVAVVDGIDEVERALAGGC